MSDYKISTKDDFNTFIILISGLLGICITVIGLYQKNDIENGINRKLHEKDIE